METKTAKQTQEEWQALALTGPEPFNDGATPEVIARNKARAEAERERTERLRKQAELRAAKRRYYTDNETLRKICKELGKVEFFTALSPDEEQKCRELARGDRQRKDVQVTIYRWLLVQFLHNGGPFVWCARHMNESGAVFRIADLMRAAMWEYRKPCLLGKKEIEDCDLNLSLKRLENDRACEPKVVELISLFKEELLRLKDSDGIPLFSKEPRERTSKSGYDAATRRYRVQTISTLMDDARKRIAILESADSNTQNAALELLRTRFTAFETTYAHLTDKVDALQKLIAMQTDIITRMGERLNALEFSQNKTEKVVVPALNAMG